MSPEKLLLELIKQHAEIHLCLKLTLCFYDFFLENGAHWYILSSPLLFIKVAK